MENQKSPRTTNKSKSFGPLRKVLDFLEFLVSAEGTTKPKIQNLSEGPETFGFFGFPRVFCFLTEIQKKTVFFLVFHLKSKNHVSFWISVGKPKKP